MSYPERGAEGLLAWLPTELLQHILSDDGLSKGDLYHLSLMSRRFRDIVQPILYGEVYLTSDQAGAIESFSETVCNNPKLAALIRDLNFSSLEGHKWMAFPKRVKGALNKLLSLHLPKLRCLVVDLEKVNLDIQKLNPILPVRTARVGRVSLAQTIALLSLPEIEDLEVWFVVIPDEQLQDNDALWFAQTDGRPPSERNDSHTESSFGPSKSSAVKFLRILNGLRLYPEFRPLIEMPRELHTLDVFITLDTYAGPAWGDIAGWFSPLHETLQQLSLKVFVYPTFITAPPPCRFNLFKCLTRLDTSAVLLFGHDSDPEDISRIDVVRRLPETLQQLIITFNVDETLLETGRIEAYDEVEMPADYLWIIGLLDLANLTSVDICEELYNKPGMRSYRHLDWEIHPLIAKPFLTREISLSIKLRDEDQNALEMAQRAERLQALQLARDARRNLQRPEEGPV